MESLLMFLYVLGKPSRRQMIRPTTANRIEHVPWSVKAFMATAKVRMWAPLMENKDEDRA